MWDSYSVIDSDVTVTILGYEPVAVGIRHLPLIERAATVASVVTNTSLRGLAEDMLHFVSADEDKHEAVFALKALQD